MDVRDNSIYPTAPIETRSGKTSSEQLFTSTPRHIEGSIFDNVLEILNTVQKDPMAKAHKYCYNFFSVQLVKRNQDSLIHMIDEIDRAIREKTSVKKTSLFYYSITCALLDCGLPFKINAMAMKIRSQTISNFLLRHIQNHENLLIEQHEFISASSIALSQNPFPLSADVTIAITNLLSYDDLYTLHSCNKAFCHLILAEKKRQCLANIKHQSFDETFTLDRITTISINGAKGLANLYKIIGSLCINFCNGGRDKEIVRKQLLLNDQTLEAHLHGALYHQIFDKSILRASEQNAEGRKRQLIKWQPSCHRSLQSNFFMHKLKASLANETSKLYVESLLKELNPEDLDRVHESYINKDTNIHEAITSLYNFNCIIPNNLFVLNYRAKVLEIFSAQDLLNRIIESKLRSKIQERLITLIARASNDFNVNAFFISKYFKFLQQGDLKPAFFSLKMLPKEISAPLFSDSCAYIKTFKDAIMPLKYCFLSVPNSFTAKISRQNYFCWQKILGLKDKTRKKVSQNLFNCYFSQKDYPQALKALTYIDMPQGSKLDTTIDHTLFFRMLKMANQCAGEDNYLLAAQLYALLPDFKMKSQRILSLIHRVVNENNLALAAEIILYLPNHESLHDDLSLLFLDNPELEDAYYKRTGLETHVNLVSLANGNRILNHIINSHYGQRRLQFQETA